jgi:opacity protein-like surface antigen
MPLFRRALLALTLLMSASPVLAADLDGDQDAVRVGPVHHKRIYLRGDVGFDWNQTREVTEHGNPLLDPSAGRNATYGIGAGWYVSPKWRADFTLEQRNDMRISGIAPAPLLPGDAPAGLRRLDVSSAVAMLNVYYDFTERDDFDPYLGAGIGWAANTSHGGTADVYCNNTCQTSFEDKTQNNFAWSLMAGFTQPLSHGLVLDAGYRFTDLGGARTGTLQQCCLAGGPIANTERSISDIYAHEFRAGLRYDIY